MNESLRLSTLTTENQCGDCALCCKVMSVPELDKPQNKWCPHAQPGSPCGGCAIYESRPESCRTFKCAWLMGKFGPSLNMRPDKCKGVVVMTETGWICVYVDAGFPGAAREGRLGQFVAHMSSLIPVLIVCGNSRSVVARGVAVSKAKAIMRKGNVELPMYEHA